MRLNVMLVGRNSLLRSMTVNSIVTTMYASTSTLYSTTSTRSRATLHAITLTFPVQ